VIIAFAATFFRKVRKLFQQVDEAEGRMTTVLQENLTGIRVVRAFTRQQFEIEKFAEQNDKFRDLEFRLFIALGNYWCLSDLLVFTQIGLVLIGGGYFVLVGSISLGTWMLFFWLLRTIIWPTPARRRSPSAGSSRFSPFRERVKSPCRRSRFAETSKSAISRSPTTTASRRWMV
jgi:ABC-type multidrug transport system fused ATPase/permease subunit